MIDLESLSRVFLSSFAPPVMHLLTWLLQVRITVRSRALKMANGF